MDVPTAQMSSSMGNVIGTLAPAAPPMVGRVVGLKPLLKYGGALTGAAAGLATPHIEEALKRRRAAKGPNDAPEPHISGTAGGHIVTEV